MRKFILLLFIVLNTAFAQTTTITEIQPHKIDNEEEWFEFQVSEASEIDMSEWKISNGSTLKNFSDFSEQLETGDDVDEIESLKFKFIKNFGIFTWKKSPLQLTNSGGIIQIKDKENIILSEATYQSSKSGTNKDYKWSEVLNLEQNSQKFLPLIYRNNKESAYLHTKLKPNRNTPTRSEDFKLIITEASLNNDNQDFIELLLESGPEKTNLKYTEIKHNGTSLWFFESDFFIKKNERILIYFDQGLYGITKNIAPYEIKTNKKPGLSSGSGTLEIINWSGTSLEKNEDFWCWKNKELSKTEQKRVNKNILKKTWKGGCWNVEGLIPNESIGLLPEKEDTNDIRYFFRHFHGSSGQENIAQNYSPNAKIKIQGSGKNSGSTPFSLNLTGEESSDPDGKKDIKTYQWRLNGKTFSEKENPVAIKIKTTGVHKVMLIVTDQGGKKNEQSITIQTYHSGGSSRSQVSVKSRIEKILEKQSSTQKLSREEEIVHRLLEKYEPKKTTRYPDYSMKKKLKSKKIRNIFKHYPKKHKASKRLVTVPNEVKPRLKKNLGILFTWNESPWPALEVESTFDAKDHQNFVYFEAKYLGV